jgi:hypothetical protein
LETRWTCYRVSESIGNTEAQSSGAERMRKTDLVIADAMPGRKYGETTFAQRLRHIRQARGTTQVQLALAAETTQRSFSYCETKSTFPPAPAVIAPAKALRIATYGLLDVKPPKIERVNASANRNGAHGA